MRRNGLTNEREGLKDNCKGPTDNSNANFYDSIVLALSPPGYEAALAAARTQLTIQRNHAALQVTIELPMR